MEQKHIPTDEQIARFLGGTATEEEKNAVLEYMSQSDENLEELMAIADAVQAQRTSQQATKTSGNRAVAWRIAASVAVVLIAGGVWFALRDRGTDLVPQSGNVVALNTTPATTTPSVADETGDTVSGTQPVTDQPTSSHNSGSTFVADADPEEGQLKPLQVDIPVKEVGRTDGQIARLQVSETQSEQSQLQPDINHEFSCNVPESWTVGTDLVITWQSMPGAEMELRIKNSKSTVNSWKTFRDATGRIIIKSDNLLPLVVTEGDLRWEMQPTFANENLTKPIKSEKGTIKVKFAE